MAVMSIIAFSLLFPRSTVPPPPLLSLTDVSYPYRRALLWKKLRICALHFDFLKPDEQARRNVKRDALADVLDTVRKQP